MGYRTVVLLDNDRWTEWANDHLLGSKIGHAMNYVNSSRPGLNSNLDNYGSVIECAHTSTMTLGVISGFHMDTHALRARQFFEGAASEEDLTLDLLKEMADKLGYKVIKKPKKKS